MEDTKKRVILHVEGGLVQECIRQNADDVEVTVLDYDTEGHDDTDDKLCTCNDAWDIPSYKGIGKQEHFHIPQ